MDDTNEKRDWRGPTLIGLAVVVVVLLGVVIGLVVSGSDDDPVAASSTTTFSVETTVPTTSPITSSTEPTPTTAPGQPGETIPPDTSTPGQIVFTASEDTVSDSTDPEVILGFEPVLAVENDTDPPQLILSLIRFEVTGVPDGVEPDSVTLRLFAEFPVDGSVSVHTVDGEWSEATTTSGNAPDIGEIVSLIPEGAGGGMYVDVDVAPAFTGNGQLDFYLATSSSGNIPFGSRESPNPPQLVVELDE